MEDIKEKIKSYKEQNKRKVFALRNWLLLNGDNYSLREALECIFNAAEGNFDTMTDIITHLTEKRKTFGRTQVYSGSNIPQIGLKRDEEGRLTLYGYRENMPLNLKGQHVSRNPRIFRKSDGQVSKTFQNSEEKIYDLGRKVRELFPDGSNHDITFIMQAIKKYANDNKIHPDKVLSSMKKGRLIYNDDLERIIPSIRESKHRTIIIKESVMNEINDELNMTEYKFNSNIKRFLHDLLVDPVNAKVPFIFSIYGYNRKRLIYFLKKTGILTKVEKISDKDTNGRPKTATMRVKYQVPKKNFDRKLKKLYIRLFENNIVQNSRKEISEDGDGSTTCDASSGQFSQPLFPLQRRTIDEETTTDSIGDYQYNVPFPCDDETMSRRNGIGGSVSVNINK